MILHIEKQGNGIRIPLNDYLIDAVTIGYQAELQIHLHGKYRMYFEVTEFEMVHSELAASVIVSEEKNIHLILKLLGQTVSACEVTDSGVLTMYFQSGLRIVAHPDKEFEHWQLYGRVEDKTFSISSEPGGGFVVNNS